MTNGLRKQLKRDIGRMVKVHPEGDYINSVASSLERKKGPNGVNTGWYVKGVQIPIRKINSTARVRGILNIGIAPDHFKLNLNRWYLG